MTCSGLEMMGRRRDNYKELSFLFVYVLFLFSFPHCSIDWFRFSYLVKFQESFIIEARIVFVVEREEEEKQRSDHSDDPKSLSVPLFTRSLSVSDCPVWRLKDVLTGPMDARYSTVALGSLV